MEIYINERLYNNNNLVVENKLIKAKTSMDEILFSENDNDVIITNNTKYFKFYCQSLDYSYKINYDYDKKTATAEIKLNEMKEYLSIKVEYFDLVCNDKTIEMTYKLESNDTINKLIIDIL